MEYLYYFENASLTLRIFEYLYSKHQMPRQSNRDSSNDGWLVRVKYTRPHSQQDEDLLVFWMNSETIKAPKYGFEFQQDIPNRYNGGCSCYSSPVTGNEAPATFCSGRNNVTNPSLRICNCWLPLWVVPGKGANDFWGWLGLFASFQSQKLSRWKTSFCCKLASHSVAMHHQD